MNPFRHLYRLIFPVVLLVAAGWSGHARAQVYVAYHNSGVISEYDQSTGAVMNDMFVLGLKGPRDLCLVDGVLYVLQADSGHISTFNAQTGQPARPGLVGGLNTPQAMAVDGGFIYVSDADWQTHQAKIEKYNAYTGALVNPSLVAFKGDSINGMNMITFPPSCLAVSGNRIIIGGENGPNGVHEYDATTGAPLGIRESWVLSAAQGVMVSGKWLWVAAGGNAPTGCVFKIDSTNPTGPGFGFAHPLFQGLDYPSRMAISGDDIFVGTGGATAIAKYNATSGALINANFIPSLNDRLGGIAVVHRELTADEMSADADYDWHQQLSHWAFMAMLHSGSLITGASLVFAAGMAVLVAILFRRKAAMPVATVEGTAAQAPPVMEAAPAPEFAEEVHLPVDENPAPVEIPEVKTEGLIEHPRSLSTLAIVASVLAVTTLAAFAVMAYLVMQPVSPISYPDAKSEADLIGAWRYENDSREPSERPVFLSVDVYPDKISFSEGNGSYEKPGKWHDDAFWIENADGSGETQAARLIDPLDMEVNINVFIPSRTDKPVLYKVMGSAAEKAAIAAKYPGPITFPPPKGAITYWMTEYDLNALPWQADSLEITGDEAYSRGIVYHYHSDNPQVPPLLVTVKNRHVVSMRGGYE